MTSPRAATAAPRRKPRQSRAPHLAGAAGGLCSGLRVEKGYAGVTIREIAAVAGTGLGSFYEYFENKDDLARVCLHLRSKALLLGMRAAVAAHAGRPLRDIVDAVIDASSMPHRVQPLAWGAHYLLERHLSSPEATGRRTTASWASGWVRSTPPATWRPTAARKASRRRRWPACARPSSTAVVAHAHIGTGGRPDLQALSRQLRGALHGYLARATCKAGPLSALCRRVAHAGVDGAEHRDAAAAGRALCASRRRRRRPRPRSHRSAPMAITNMVVDGQ